MYNNNIKTNKNRQKVYTRFGVRVFRSVKTQNGKQAKQEL